MAAKGPRENITLECTEFKSRNYTTSKNKRNNTERLEVVKYCKYCKKRTTHKHVGHKSIMPLWLFNTRHQFLTSAWLPNGCNMPFL